MQGKNFAWHIDQYDKLSTFEFYIHGCIDGYIIIIISKINHNNSVILSYSRKVLWLRLTSTNRDPAVTLGYFLECINAVNGNYIIYIMILY